MSRMLTNKFRAMLNEGKPTLGTRILSTKPYVTETVGASGNFDYVEFVAEYAPVSQDDMENICRAAELHGMASMIKLDFQNRGFVAQKAAASGFQAIMFVDHKTPEEVRESVNLMKSDNPASKGRFGYPTRRWIGYQPMLPQMEHAKRTDDVVLVFMIEKKEALDNIEEICSIPGVDMVQFGPADYSMSLGWNVSEHLQEVKAAERRMIEVALKHGVRPRVEIYGEAKDAQPYIKLGVKDFIFGDEGMIYTKFVNNTSKVFRDMVNEIK